MKTTLKYMLASACFIAMPACAQEDATTSDEANLIALEADAESPWRAVDPEDLLLITTVHGTTAIELNDDFAPNHAARMRALARAEFLDGEYFYRVIEGFVAQGGVQHEDRMTDWENLVNENSRPMQAGKMTPLGNDDLFASAVGHSADGFPMAQDAELQEEWLLHCPGALAMARDVDPDTGGTEFYITLAPQRYLDRNLTVFGRVIDGMQYLQKLERGDRAIESGVIQAPNTGDEMLSVRIAADLPEDERPAYEVQRAGTEAFEDAKTARRVREAEFFYRKPPEVLDICGFEVPVRRVEQAD